MTYDVNGFPTTPVSLGPIPGATLNNPDTEIWGIPGVQDPVGSVYQQNQVAFSKTLMLNRTFNILLKMIGVLQKAATAEANRLNFLTSWQTAYTESLNQMHSFAGNNGDAFDTPSDSYDSQLMSNLNAVNQSYTTQLQNNLSTISDMAKSQQTSVSQTADAASQQSNLATSFLQTLNTLLTTILSGK